MHNPRSHMYDSNGPSVRIRGSALQIFEKYSQLARDSLRTDRIAAENLAQHAEHYFRLANANSALANGSGNGAERHGNQGRPNGAGQDGEGEEHYAQSSDGDNRPPEDADGQQGRQRHDQRRQQHQHQRPAEGQSDRPAAAVPVEATVVEPEPTAQVEPEPTAAVESEPAPQVEAEPADSPVKAAPNEKPPRRRRSARPRKAEPESSPGDDSEPVQA